MRPLPAPLPWWWCVSEEDRAVSEVSDDVIMAVSRVFDRFLAISQIDKTSSMTMTNTS